MKFLITILFLFISCHPAETPYPEWQGESRSEGTVQQIGDDGEAEESITERTAQQGRDAQEAAEERRTERAEQQKRAEREAEERRIERAKQQRRAEREAEERRIERAKQQRRAEREAEERRIERAEQQRRDERGESSRTPTESEPTYIISFLSTGLVPHSMELTANGETLSFDPNSFPICVALKQSELNTLSVDVYTAFFILLGNHLNASILEECSCSNNRDAETEPCTTKNDNYTFTISGGHFLGFIVGWECTFEVQTTDIPNVSDCSRF